MKNWSDVLPWSYISLPLIQMMCGLSEIRIYQFVTQFNLPPKKFIADIAILLLTA